MANNYHCAACGRELKTFLKGIPKKGIILTLIEPHVCNPDEIVDDYEFLPEREDKATFGKGIAEKVFEEGKRKELNFPFVSKLNKAQDTKPLPLTGDRRPEKNHREEIKTSTAPHGIMARTGANHTPVSTSREVVEPDD